jgi:hypothetical protein
VDSVSELVVTPKPSGGASYTPSWRRSSIIFFCVWSQRGSRWAGRQQRNRWAHRRVDEKQGPKACTTGRWGEGCLRLSDGSHDTDRLQT